LTYVHFTTVLRKKKSRHRDTIFLWHEEDDDGFDAYWKLIDVHAPHKYVRAE